MNEFRRITVPLGRDEWEKLRILAAQDYRHPREQARYILRGALGLNSGTPDAMLPRNDNGAAKVSSQPGAAV